jgi:hypothetical protein
MRNKVSIFHSQMSCKLGMPVTSLRVLQCLTRKKRDQTMEGQFGSGGSAEVQHTLDED